jgi:hypothetical protein
MYGSRNSLLIVIEYRSQYVFCAESLPFFIFYTEKYINNYCIFFEDKSHHIVKFKDTLLGDGNITPTSEIRTLHMLQLSALWS